MWKAQEHELLIRGKQDEVSFPLYVEHIVYKGGSVDDIDVGWSVGTMVSKNEIGH